MHTVATNRHPLTIVLAACALAFGAALAQLAPADEQPFTDDPDAVVIVFGDTTITMAEFDRAFELAARGTAIGQGLPVTDEVMQEFEPFKAGFLEQYATQRILAVEAETRGLAASEERVDAVVDELRAEQPDDAAFQAWLETAGYGDVPTLRAQLAVNLSVQAVVDDLAADVEVRSEDVQAWYDTNPQAVTTEDGEVMPLEAIEEQIAQLLVREAVDREVQAIVLASDLALHPHGR